MNVYHRKFGWSKALLTVLGVALILYLLDYSIHLRFHSDVSADIGRHSSSDSKWPAAPNVAPSRERNNDRKLPEESRDRDDVPNAKNNAAAEIKRRQNPLFPHDDVMPPDPNNRKQRIVNPLRDVGFRRNAKNEIVFDPNAVILAEPKQPVEEEHIEMRDPKKPKQAKSSSKQKGKNSSKQKQSQEEQQPGGLTSSEKAAKLQRQNIVNRLEQLYGRVKKAQGYDDEGNFYSHGADTPTHCDVMTRPTEDEIDIRNEQWQVMDGVQHDVLLHSAYLDARRAFDDTPAVRVMLVISGVFFHGRPHCLFWYNQSDQPVSIPATSVNRLSTHRKHFVNNIQYSMYMFSCKIPADMRVPDEVSMVMYPCESPYNILPVILPYDDTVKHDFAVCVIGQWARIGDVEAAFLTEWIEAYSMFGVGEINIYNVSLKVTPMVQKVIDHYTSVGRLRLVHQTAPITALDEEDEYDASQLCLRTSANDCLLRNVNRYNYIMVIDRDEILTPRKHDSYQDMVKQWANTFGSEYETYPAITVQNSFFYMDFDPDENQPAYLATMRYRLRQPPDMPNTEHGFQPGKSVVNTQQCKIVWNHNCQLPTEPKVLAPVSTAMLHHYRRGCLIASRKKDTGIKEHECEWIKFREIEDNHMLKYKQPLQARVDAVFAEIGINSTYLSHLLHQARTPT